jgi:uncharacterized membrane protein YbhN (UPF0104 family)
VRRHLWTFVRVAVALGGLALTAWIVEREGLDAIGQAIAQAIPVLPLAMALEVGRLLCETLATRTSLGARGRAVPIPRLFLGQLVAHAMLNVAPGGRAAAEVTKAALIAPWVGGAEAAGAATMMQAATFVGVGSMSAACAVGTWAVSGTGALFWLLVGNAALLCCLGVGMRALLRSARAVGWLIRRLPERHRHLERFREAARAGDLFAFQPALFLFLGMGCQVLQMRVLAGAVGAAATMAAAFAAQGVHLVTASAAQFVPGQLGAREAAFVLAAKTLGTTPARAATIAIVAHLSQLSLAAVGFVTLLAWRHRRGAQAGTSTPMEPQAGP